MSLEYAFCIWSQVGEHGLGETTMVVETLWGEKLTSTKGKGPKLPHRVENDLKEWQRVLWQELRIRSFSCKSLLC